MRRAKPKARGEGEPSPAPAAAGAPAPGSAADGTEADLLAWRREFPILAKTRYLASHSMGAMPRGVYAHLRQYADGWAREGLAAYAAWLPRVRETADLIGSLFNAPPGTVVMHQNASTLMAAVISAIHDPRSRRRKVVYTDLNFPSIHYNWVAHERLGLSVRILRSPDGIHVPTEMVVDALDEETLAVVLDHGIFRSGYLQDVEAIARAARAKGVVTVVDAYQTVGCVPVDVRAWGVEFLLGGSHKWLCGGPGAAYLYVRRDLTRKLAPRVTGWFSHKRPFAFDMRLVYADDAMRFATGTPNVPGVHAARAGVEIVKAVGPARVRAKSVRLTQRLVEEALAAGLTVNSPLDPNRRTGVVCIDFPGAARAEEAFLRRGIHLDYRPRCGLRVSAHFYTREDEFLSIVPEIRRFLARRGRGAATRR